jgi:hypothetical protein
MVDDERVAELINKTLHTKPADGSTHWSTRTLARETGICESTVTRYLQAFQLKPHRVESFKLSTNPLLIEKLLAVVALDPRSRRHDHLTEYFPSNKPGATGAYIAELEAAGHEPPVQVLDEAWLVRCERPVGPS